MGVEGTQSQINLPPGFRFYPTDEELVVHYLCRKAASQSFAVPVIAEVELYKFNPWDLPEKALFGEKEWYFFSPRDRKYPNGSRPNRAAASGYWKATGTDKSITSGGATKVGVKKTLVFYQGRPTKGVKTNWIMHEYCLADNASRAAKRKGSLRLDDWVLCRVYKKASGAQKGDLAKKLNNAESLSAPFPQIDDTKALMKLGGISSSKSAGQYHYQTFQNGGTANCSGGRRVINAEQCAWRKSVEGGSPNLANNGRKEQRCNAATDVNAAEMRLYDDVYLGSSAPALGQMDCLVWENPRMPMETTAEEIRQISDSPLQRLSSIEMLFGLDLSNSSFPPVEAIPPLGGDDPFLATLY